MSTAVLLAQIDEANAALLLDENDIKTRQNLAQWHYQVGRNYTQSKDYRKAKTHYENASEQFEKLAKMRPEYWLFYLSMANTYYWRGETNYSLGLLNDAQLEFTKQIDVTRFLSSKFPDIEYLTWYQSWGEMKLGLIYSKRFLQSLASHQYQISADHGSELAAKSIAGRFRRGIGVPKDLELAEKYERLVAELKERSKKMKSPSAEELGIPSVPPS